MERGCGVGRGLWLFLTYWVYHTYIAFRFQKTCRNSVCLKFVSLCETGLKLAGVFHRQPDKCTDSYGQCICITLILSRNKAVKKSTVIEKAGHPLC